MVHSIVTLTHREVMHPEVTLYNLQHCLQRAGQHVEIRRNQNQGHLHHSTPQRVHLKWRRNN